MSKFSEFVHHFKAGHLDATLTRKMQDLVEAVAHHQAAGSLTITINMKPKNDGEMMTSVKFKTKAPERDSMDSIMYATPDNNLINTNPMQPELFSRPLDEKTTPIRKIKE